MVLKGRVRYYRDHGNISFFDLRVEQKVFKCYISKDKNLNYAEVKKELFLGCVLTVQLEKTKNNRGEEIHHASDITVESSKSVFPQKYPKSAFLDLELKYKHRTLDILSNMQTFETLKKRFEILKKIRSFLENRKFLEVDLPVLEEHFGGAVAKPFFTQSLYNKKNYYLRISFEFPMKKLIIGGFQNIFTLGSVFRNEDIDSTHTFEFQMLELYTSEYGVKEVLEMGEDLYRELYYFTNNTYFKNGFDLRSKWPIYNKDSLELLLKEHKMSTVDELISNRLLGPFYHLQNLEDIPLGIAPNIYESYVDYGMELVTMYQEENNYKNLIEKLKKAPVELQIKDPTFLEGLEYGMPSTVGFGIGLDRLIKSVLNSKTLRNVQVFPLV